MRGSGHASCAIEISTAVIFPITLIYGEPSGMEHQFKQAIEGAGWPVTPQWLAQDALASINNLVQPSFVFALALGVACFALLVLRRQRA